MLTVGFVFCARAVGMRVEAVTRNPHKARVHDDMFDAVVLTAPHTPKSENLFDDATLITNLRSGHVGWAVPDVPVAEPLPPDRPSFGEYRSRGKRAYYRHFLWKPWLPGGDFHRMKNIFDKKALY